MRDRSIGKKKIAILFTTNRTDTVGSAILISIFEFLTTKYKATLVTNQSEFIRRVLPNCRVVSPKSPGWGKLPVIRDFLAWQEFAREVNRLNVDMCFLLHQHSAVINWLKCPSVCYVNQLGARSGIRAYCVKEMAKRFIQRIQNTYSIRGLAKADLVFVASEQIRGILERYGIYSAELLPHAFSLKNYQEPTITDQHSKLKALKERGHFIVSYTGWVTESRGFPLLLEAIDKVINAGKNVVLVIAGAEPIQSQMIRQYARDHRIEQCILDMGTVEANLIPGILSFSDACISLLDNNIPAYHVSPPQKVIEYFAAGKAVICNKISTHESLVINRTTGLITEYSSDSVSVAIMELYDNPKLLSFLSRNALEESCKYDIDVVYGKMVETINIVVLGKEVR